MKVFFTNRFYWLAVLLTILFIIAYFFALVLPVAKLLLAAFLLICGIDTWLLFGTKGTIEASRKMRDRFSNSDENEVKVAINNLFSFKTNITVLDELPFQFQIRNFHFNVSLISGEGTTCTYLLKPVTRGVYSFGNINILVESAIGLITRRIIREAHTDVKVYPSFIKLQQYGLLAISQDLIMAGQRTVRKVGNSTEFDTIRDYVMGDDPRHINWNATARRGHIMTNHYVAERSQNIYCLIDKGRSMKMPFEEMTLLDYSINASLILSEIIMKKGDKAGLLTFEDKPDTFIKASSSNIQINHILETLYAQQTSFREHDFGSLYTFTRKNITQRSLLLLFTNFESIHSLKRQLKYLELINRQHLLLVVYFRNTEVDNIVKDKAKNTREIYEQAIAYNMLDEKLLIKDELSRAGILSLYTNPHHLNVDVINKYIEIKARQLL